MASADSRVTIHMAASLDGYIARKDGSVALEGWHVAASPVFIITTLASLAMCIWAIYLYRRQRSGSMQPRQ